MPGNLQPLLRAQAMNGMVYLMAAHALRESTVSWSGRSMAVKIYLFDISASKKPGQNHPIRVYVQESGEPGDLNDGNARCLEHQLRDLTRFAARQLPCTGTTSAG